ncbi:MAG: sensor histidine kinase [Nocardioidaceae bacterium]
MIFLLLSSPLVLVLARRLDRSAADRERLLLAAVEASDIERRRIARDLHDGVVQELAGISFTLSATARQIHEQPEMTRTLDSLGAGVRRSLRALRSLLVEIYPPDLRTQGLPTALDDLLAPAAAAGIAVSVEVEDTSKVAPDQVALVWRGAQEAVRNAIRHGRPRRLLVRVAALPGGVQLEVRDDGVGFDPAVDPPYGHFGLRSIRDLVEEAGGSVEISSVPDHGTAFRMTLGETGSP